MQAANPSLAFRIRVGVLCEGESLPSSFLSELAREVISASRVESGALQRLSDIDVLLLWVSAGTTISQELIRWGSERHVGLIGCAPHGDVNDTLAAFEAGVDDFVAGRCQVRELASRIRTLQKRLKHAKPPARLAIQDLQLDAAAHEVRRGSRVVQISPTEASVLAGLLRSRGQVLSRSAILELAWGDQQLGVGERAVDNVILRLRRKLGEPEIIETVRGVGFRLAAQD